MSPCEYSAMLSPYYDGELEPRQYEQVHKHLDGCYDCAVELDQLRAISRALAMLAVPEASPRLMSRIEADAEAVKDLTLVRFVRKLTALAAVLLIAAVCRVGWNSITPAPVAPIELATWERTAIDPDPTTALASTDSQTDSQFDDFIAHDLSGGIQ